MPLRDILPPIGLGLTNLCPRASRAASELSSAELTAGVIALRRKVARVQPRIVALVGVMMYPRIFGLKASGGAGPKPQTLGDARVFVLPNPSGLNASHPGFEDKLVWFKQLRLFAFTTRAQSSPAETGAPGFQSPRTSAQHRRGQPRRRR